MKKLTKLDLAALRKLTIATVVACCCVSAAIAQNMNIRGRVYNKTDNQPIWGAAIFLNKGTVSNRDGFFEFDSTKDSLQLSVQQIGYLPYQKTLPGNYEGELDIFLEPDPVLDTMIIRFGGTPNGIMGGRILDKEGKPIEGATVVITGKDLPVRVLASDLQGAFRANVILDIDHRTKEGKNNIYTDLDVFAPGHKPFDYRFRRIDKPSQRVKHDGLIIEIDFYE